MEFYAIIDKLYNRDLFVKDEFECWVLKDFVWDKGKKPRYNFVFISTIKDYMIKLCIVTGTRAEYGLLRPLIKRLREESFCEIELLITGAHLCAEFGNTWQEVEQDEHPNVEKVEIQLAGDSGVAMVKSIGVGLISFADYFQRKRPDLLIVLGDRYEIFSCATAAACMKIPIAHLYGGDTTEGAVDEFLRHAITKMSQLHFVSNEQSRRRVIQMGENPNNVYNVGSLGIENAGQTNFLSREALMSDLNVDLSNDYILMTYHPETLVNSDVEEQMLEIFQAIETFPNYKYIVTKANADSQGRKINAILDGYANNHDNFNVYTSLGSRRYLSVMKYAKMVIGNSSSGLYETPIFGVPCVNIGQRQKGRLRAENVIDCRCTKKNIVVAMELALTETFQKQSRDVQNPFGDGHSSEKIVDVLRTRFAARAIDVNKTFYNLKE